MIKSVFSLLWAFLFLIASAVLLLCTLPENLEDPRYAEFNVIFKTPDGVVHPHSVIDTAGKKIKIGAALILPAYFDSIRLVIDYKGQPEFETTFKNYFKTEHSDTAWTEYVFDSAGIWTAVFTPFTTLDRQAITANITIVPASAAATNSKPSISVEGHATIRPMETCTLIIRTSDNDTGQNLLLSMSGNPEGSIIQNDSLFIWTAAEGSIGTHNVTFTVTDNGNPALSDSIDITITVSQPEDVNSAPRWSVDTLQVSINDTASYSLKLSDICSDPDGDLLTYNLLEGPPAGDTVAGVNYTFTATEMEIGRHNVAVTARDPHGDADTLVIELIVEHNAVDTTPPSIVLTTPPAESAVSTADSFTIAVICTDAGGIASVEAVIDGNRFPASLTGGQYTVTVRGLKREVDNTIVITATDASENANKATKSLTITFNPPCTVLYDGNGNTGGSVPVDDSIYSKGMNVTVKGNTGDLVKTGAVFTGWNTSEDGAGVNYTSGETFKMGN
ncbi:MAG: InlB B-repeat-containing protein, partial [Chitinispirillaceae bacterium]|nr:InlB B-repeat-containing protein [Chitinispirillaceae bacterium]